MDKNIIKRHLTERFLTEASSSEEPAISMANKMKKENGKVNKDGVKAIDKDMSAYDKDLKKKEKGTSTMAVNKFNATDDFQKTYHDEMEIRSEEHTSELQSL